MGEKICESLLYPEVDYMHYFDPSSDRLCHYLKAMIIGGELQLCFVQEDPSAELKLQTTTSYVTCVQQRCIKRGNKCLL
jgi:hypothetical protein